MQPRSRIPIPWLFTAAIFAGSALLFLVQPMVAKMLLPAYGGTPAVWNTSMVFFQAALLLGYGYAHLSYKWLGPRIQPILHLAVMGLAFSALPIAFSPPSPEEAAAMPALRLLAQLAGGVGIPFLVVSAGAPLLQRWYAATGLPGSKDPYFLYAASNLASILALLAYPIAVEPFLRLRSQSALWGWGFGGLSALVFGCAAVVLAKARGADEARTVPDEHVELDWKRVLHWIALSFVPSSLLLGVTTYLTTNLASAPMLWVVPLALYLLTFVIAFSKRKAPSSFIGRFVAMLAAPMVLVIVLEATEPILALGAMHLLLFFIGALMCHTRLYETRPAASQLTAFYFWISVGGVLGGAFNALLAPVLFNSVAEYSIALVGLILLIPRDKPQKPVWSDFAFPLGVLALTAAAFYATKAAGMEASKVRTAITLGLPALASFVLAERPLRYGLALGSVFVAARLLNIGGTGDLLVSERSFFGVHRVFLTEKGRFRELMHGNTIHGRQSTAADLRRNALTYYHRTGPIGQAFEVLQQESRIRDVGLVGMGVGSLSTYGRPGQKFTFYEIDPTVVKLARDSGLFSFIEDSEASIEVVLGDARLSLVSAPDHSFDLLVLDAFSSDSIPTHLLTLEAIRLYRTKLREGGVMAFHISNRYLQLEPVLAAAARDLGLSGLYQDDLELTDEEKAEGKSPSSWVLLALYADALRGFETQGGWLPLAAEPGSRPWTDDFSNLIEPFIRKARENKRAGDDGGE